jgi:glucose-6-phosphate isomerase
VHVIVLVNRFVLIFYKNIQAAMKSGAHINATEDRAVMHIALRTPKGKSLMVDGVDVIPAVHEVLSSIANFTARVRSGEWVGATGKTLTNVVAIGIGGSYLGPEFVYEALRTNETAKAAATGRILRFLANVDPVDVSRALSGLDAETTLVVVVSKTFTTAETMLNARTLKKWLTDSIPGPSADVIRQHMCAVRCEFVMSY